MGLMALVALVPFGVIMAVVWSGRGEDVATRNGVATGQGQRRLQTTYSFATQFEMTVCLTADHSTDSASVSADQVCQSVRQTTDIEDSEVMRLSSSLTMLTAPSRHELCELFVHCCKKPIEK